MAFSIDIISKLYKPSTFAGHIQKALVVTLSSPLTFVLKVIQRHEFNPCDMIHENITRKHLHVKDRFKINKITFLSLLHRLE